MSQVEFIRRCAELVQEDLEAQAVTNAISTSSLTDAVRDSCMRVIETTYSTADLNDILDKETALEALVELVNRDFFQYGAIQPFLDDDDITEICINNHESIFVERNGVLSRVEEKIFESDDEVYRLISKIASELGKRCDSETPMMDARLSDGSRINAAIPPVAVFGPCLTVRKFPKAENRYDADALIDEGTCTVNAMKFLACMVEAKCNILVSGGTGAGKTTLLNVLCDFIGPNERVITVEDVVELSVGVDNWVSMEARAANSDGRGEVSIHQLVVNALRQRPDRIIVGECRSSETVEMLQAMNTGHDGSLTTIHANDPRSAFLRIATMVQATENLDIENIYRQIASAIQIVVQLRRFNDGSRKISEIVALTGSIEESAGAIITQPLFKYQKIGKADEGELWGLVPCGSSLPEQIKRNIDWTGTHFDPAWLKKGGDAR